MGRPSKIDRLPPEIRAQLLRLLDNGRSVDEVKEALDALDLEEPISRSSVGRYMQRIAEVREDNRRADQAAEALTRDLGDSAEERLLRANLNQLSSALMAGFMAEREGPNGEPPKPVDPLSANRLAKTLESIARTRVLNVEHVTRIEKRAAEVERKAAAGRAAEAAKSKGMSSETADFIAAQVLGVTA